MCPVRSVTHVSGRADLVISGTCTHPTVLNRPVSSLLNNICARRPSAVAPKPRRKGVGMQSRFDYFRSSPDTRQLSAVPPRMLRIGNSLVRTYGFVGKGPNVPVAQKVRKLAFGSSGTAKMLSFPAGFELPPHRAENLYCPAPLSKAGSTSLP